MTSAMADYRIDLIGNHPSMESLKDLIERLAKSPARTVLLYGETGTGKGLVARMIHRLSTRSPKEFMDINCAAIPASLLESELFGHERGAFTGAVERKLGLIEAANNGTVFLDEIRELDMTLQAKFLSLLDTHQFRRVGAVKATSVDVRFIAATNKVLLSEVTDGKFREDLYYRLQVVALNLPSLRERGDDVLLLAQFFIDRFNATFKRHIKGLSEETIEIFRHYAWPGNVRELENLLERIFILEEDNVILPCHLPDRIVRNARAAGAAIAGVSGISSGASPPNMVASAGFQDATAAFQRQLIAQALRTSKGSIQDAAAALKISRHALRHQMNKLGVQ